MRQQQMFCPAVRGGIKLRMCSRCEHTYYCSKVCQQADWKQHKKVCLPLTKQKAAVQDVRTEEEAS